MHLHIRPETAHDHHAIAAVTQAAFAQAPHSDHREVFIVAALRAAGVLRCALVAHIADGSIVGHLAASPVTITDGNMQLHDWVGLGPVSVLPQWQRQGIGTQLIHHAMEQLSAQGVAGCVVLGDPAYYGRFGFAPLPALQLPGVPPAYFMARAFGGAVPRGVVSYHAGFAATA